MKRVINKGDRVTIMGWMITDLHLKGNELLIYAVINEFCKDEGRAFAFTETTAFFQEWTGLSYQGVQNVLNSLVEKDLLRKKYVIMDNTRKCRYSMPKWIAEIKRSSSVDEESVCFIPPTIDQVREYCDIRQNAVDPEAFVSFYQSKGWLVGKSKMKDWKAAVRTWERKRSKTVSSTPEPESKIEKAMRQLEEMGITNNNTAF